MNGPAQPPAPGARARSRPRRYLETRGALGGLSRPHLAAHLRAADGTALRGAYLPGHGDGDVAVCVAHGFAANHRKPAYARLADALATRTPVLTLDLRGHGGSAGACTLGDREATDVAAGVAWLHAAGHRRVVVVGASMGATAALHAAATGVDVAALVLVSAPAWFHDPPRTEPLRRLHAVWRSPWARAGLRVGLGVRLEGPDGWRSPPPPVEMIASVRAPVLVVHGADDAYFPSTDADALVAAAGGPARVWHEPAGFGHAEDGLEEPFIGRLVAAITHMGAHGTFPPRG